MSLIRVLPLVALLGITAALGTMTACDAGGAEFVPDNDGDGFLATDDCDDDDPSINPEAEDIPGDGIDQDCDGEDASSDSGA